MLCSTLETFKEVLVRHGQKVVIEGISEDVQKRLGLGPSSEGVWSAPPDCEMSGGSFSLRRLDGTFVGIDAYELNGDAQIRRV